MMRQREPLRLSWINPGEIESRHGRQTSERVCIRLRCLAPGLELFKRGHEAEGVSLFAWEQWANYPGFYDRDLFIVGKAFLDVSPIRNTDYLPRGTHEVQRVKL